MGLDRVYPVHRERTRQSLIAARVRAWVQPDVKRCAGYADGRIEVPDGWPDGNDPDDYVEDYVGGSQG